MTITYGFFCKSEKKYHTLGKKFSFLPQNEIFLFFPALIAPNVQKNPAWAPIGVYKRPKYKIENGGTLAGHTVHTMAIK